MEKDHISLTLFLPTNFSPSEELKEYMDGFHSIRIWIPQPLFQEFDQYLTNLIKQLRS